MSMVVDRNKIRRQRKKVRETIQSLSSGVSITALYFDGRKDKTLVLKKHGKKFYRRTVMEEHYVLVQEPDCKYLGHITPKSSSAADISSGIIEFLKSSEVDMKKLAEVGCDGTVVNSGYKGYSHKIHRIEFQ